MLKPIKPKKYITGGAGLDFARRIIGRGAARGLYEPSYGELIFAVGAVGERGDIMSVLELLENVLDALKNGFRGHGGRLSLYVSGTLSLVRNILSVGGNSSEYRAAAAIYNEICGRLSGGSVTVKSADNKSSDMHNSDNFDRIDNFDNFDDLREKLHDTVRLVKNAEKKHSEYNTYREYTARELPAASALGASAVWTLRMAGRDPELLKTVKSNRSFLELALRCEEMRRRSTELRRGFSMLIANLNEQQSEFLGRFIRGRGLFSSVLTAQDGGENAGGRSAEELQYLAEHSTERELRGFFREFYRELRSLDTRSFYKSGKAASMLSEQVFSSEKDMRGFFETADLKSVERLCERLSEQSRGEVNILREAEREYEKLAERSEELVKQAFSVLERQMGEDNFSWENFREKMRLSEHLKEYLPNEESISDVLYGADNELVLSFAEFAVNRARELQSGTVREISLETAEKLERILYYGQSEISEKCAEIRKLLSTDRETAELLRLYAEFMGMNRAEGIIREIRAAAESVKPENRLEAVRELLFAAGGESAEAQRLSEKISEFTAQFGSGSFLEILERSGGYSKLGALFAENSERFAERVSEWLSEFDGKELEKTLEQLRLQFENFENTQGRELLREFQIALEKTENSSRTEDFENFSEFERTANGFLSVLELCENHGGELSETFLKTAETLEKFRRSESADFRRQTASELLKTLSERSFSENSEEHFSRLRAIPKELSEIASEEQFSSEKFSKLENEFYELAEKTSLEYSENSTVRDNAVQSEINALLRELSELKNSAHESFELDSRRYFERISRILESIGRSDINVQSETNKSVSEYVSWLSELANTLSERSFSEKHESVRERFARELFKAISDSAAVQSIGDTLNVLRLTGGGRDLTVSPRFEADFHAEEFSGLSESLVYGVSERSDFSALSNSSSFSRLSNSSNFSNSLRVILRERDIEKILPKMNFIALRRNSVERQTTRAARELLIRLAKTANSPSERIFRQTSEQTERTDYSAAELFYTEEYFDSSRGAVSVNYALPPKSVFDNPDEVTGRISGLKSKLDDVSRQLESVKNSEEEMTKRFMLKSERAVLEKEIKSSIEQDITLAGKRHGIF